MHILLYVANQRRMGSVVMLRIVEDDSPPIPEGLSDSPVTLLKEYFYKVPEERPSAKKLSQYEWLKGSLNKVGGHDAINLGS